MGNQTIHLSKLLAILLYLPFSAAVFAQDTSRPDSQITSPAVSSSTAAVNMSGIASDDVAVAKVMLSIKNLDLQKN